MTNLDGLVAEIYPGSTSSSLHGLEELCVQQRQLACCPYRNFSVCQNVDKNFSACRAAALVEQRWTPAASA